MAVLSFYPAKFIMRSEDPSSFRITDLWTFRSSKSHKRYIVEIEFISSLLIGVKFYWKGTAESKNRYSLLTNDFEPRTIILSCIRIVLDYIEKNPFMSFGFVAAEDSHARETSILSSNYDNKRFRFYQRMMISLFSPDSFYHYVDRKNHIYILLNSKAVREGITSIAVVTQEIVNAFDLDFLLSHEKV